MFNVGEEVIIISDLYNNYDFTKIGSYGTVISGEEYGRVRVQFNYINNISWRGEDTHKFLININDLSLLGPIEDPNHITRKIKNIYARQYRKTGQSCFL